jgi:hypothetical protein
MWRKKLKKKKTIDRQSCRGRIKSIAAVNLIRVSLSVYRRLLTSRTHPLHTPNRRRLNDDKAPNDFLTDLATLGLRSQRV